MKSGEKGGRTEVEVKGNKDISLKWHRMSSQVLPACQVHEVSRGEGCACCVRVYVCAGVCRYACMCYPKTHIHQSI